MTITLHIPQTLLVILTITGLILAAKNHNTVDIKPKNFFDQFLGSVILYGLLIWGGFFG